jgi:D-alanyl-D-alanine dipeptidase
MLVTGPTLAGLSAKVQLYERLEGKDWQAFGGPKAAVLGKNGMAWSWAHEELAEGMPLKREGDRSTPAGIFALGKPFGFAESAAPGYVRLRPGEHYCVDDPASPHYNAIVTKAAAAGASGEEMAAMPLYRRGLFVDYPTSRERKGGSCIFVHSWRSRSSGTAGCVALQEADVEFLQRWSAGRKALIAILPQSALERLRSCFPGL